ncbi:hypothetical protein WDZ92_01100 [Nostoc sp. NIES-2111]
MANISVPLTKRYEKPGDPPFDTIVLREPTYEDIFPSGLGMPMEVQPGPHGSRMVVSYPVTVDAYLQRLVVSPGYDAVRMLGPLDSIRLEKAVCGFFMDAADSTSPQTSSSSASDGTQPASSE